ncbi:hypothetical protein LSTR_LSTR013057 [Laodelphax striatellus]|uniref:Uncharacterized protein n=1 Tax=Laodelphax striatellus TaxID=195883 RepID=A0A482XCU7_LAOST|nr:hypothetical protein LSTR_LSTR013057 [Laodelphax striatellus]
MYLQTPEIEQAVKIMTSKFVAKLNIIGKMLKRESELIYIRELQEDRLYNQKEKMLKNVINLVISVVLLCCLLISNASGRSIYSRRQPHHHPGGFGGPGPGGFGGGYNPYGGGGFGGNNGFNGGGFNPNFSNSNAASQSASFNFETPFGGFSASNSASNAFGSNFQG